MKPLLSVENLKMHFPVKGGVFLRSVASCKAVDGVSLTVHEGETLGLVGESGCGKSTLGKCMVRLLEPTDGRVDYDGSDITHMKRSDLLSRRRDLQMIFQDPAESLNPRHTVGEIVSEPFIIHRMGDRQERQAKVGELLEKVGLSASAAERFPFEFSGGQRQRIGIARAIALNPRMIICDEPVSALDVSIQSQILNLLLELRDKLELTMIFISHDLSVVHYIADNIAVMYSGKIVEYGEANEVFLNPKDEYTRKLLSAIPQMKDPATVSH